jgi:hypothetical protein
MVGRWRIRVEQLIRSSGQVFQDRPAVSPPLWADVPGLSTRDRDRLAAWQQCWQQSNPYACKDRSATVLTCSLLVAAVPSSPRVTAAPPLLPLDRARDGHAGRLIPMSFSCPAASLAVASGVMLRSHRHGPGRGPAAASRGSCRRVRNGGRFPLLLLLVLLEAFMMLG